MTDPTLNLAALLRDSTVVGPGRRDAIWVQGCTIGCPGCANQDYLPVVERHRLPISTILRCLAEHAGASDGISVLGGEPTEQPQGVAALLRGARELGLSTVVFSGRTLEELQERPECAELLAYTDLLIDGPFIGRLRGRDLYWRGSSNQRFIRLTSRFSEADLAAPAANGEIHISGTTVIVNGVGTVGLRLRRR